MKIKIILASLCLLISYKCFCKCFFISNQGDDKNNGISIHSPWKSTNKVNEMINSFSPGDSILFARNQIFYGSLIVKTNGHFENPVYFGAYGVGETPVISGSKQIKTWEYYKNNIWVCSLTIGINDINSLYINNISQTKGRFPNNGYSRITEVVNNTEYKDHSLNIPFNYLKSGEMVTKTSKWIIDRTEITSNNSNTFIIKSIPTYSIKKNTQYFIQNHLNTLDRHGEWCYDSQQKKLYLYVDPDINIKDLTIEIPFYKWAVKLGFNKNIVISDLHFNIYSENAFNIYKSENITLSRNKISHCDISGINISESNNIDISNNQIFECHNNALVLENSQNLIVTNNDIHNIALIPGQGRNGNGQYLGIKIMKCQDSKIFKNRIDSIGYSGIFILKSGNQKISQNNIKNCCLIKEDGGGIYTWNTSYMGNEISENKISQIGKSSDSQNQDSTFVYAIYIDDRSSNFSIENNVIFNCIKGIYIHNSDSIYIKSNNLYNNNINLLMVQWGSIGDVYMIRDCKIIGNNFYILGEHNQQIKVRSNKNDIDKMADFSDNTFYQPDHFKSINISFRENKKMVNMNLSPETWGKTKHNKVIVFQNNVPLLK